MANGTLVDFLELYKLTANDFQKFDGKNEGKIEADLTQLLLRNTQQLVKRLQDRLETLRLHQNDYGPDFNVRVAALQDQIDQLQAKPPDDVPPPPPNEHGGGGVVPQPHFVVDEAVVPPAKPRPRRKGPKRGEGDDG